MAFSMLPDAAQAVSAFLPVKSVMFFQFLRLLASKWAVVPCVASGASSEQKSSILVPGAAQCWKKALF